jgi:HSP20 family protein
MKAPSIWNPFREMEELMEYPLHELAEARPGMLGLFGRWPACTGTKENMLVIEWLPRVDVMETEKEFLVKAELPEVKKEEFKVTVEKGVLSITGERKLEKEEKGKNTIGSNGPMAASNAASCCPKVSNPKRSLRSSRKAC